MVRIAIIGGSGAGKSTLARCLGTALGTEVHHIDKMYWQSGWNKRDEAEFVAMATEVLDTESWIFDGFPGQCWETHGHLLDILVFLDTSYFIRLWRVLSRSVKNGRSRGVDNSGNFWGIFRKQFIYNWLFGWHLKAHKRCLAVLKNAPTDAKRVHLTAESDINSFVSDIKRTVSCADERSR